MANQYELRDSGSAANLAWREAVLKFGEVYPDGGYPLTAADFALSAIKAVIPCDALPAKWDSENSKLRFYLLDGDAAADVAGTLTTVLTGTHNDLVFTGAQGNRLDNLVNIEYLDPGTASAALAVSVDGNAITVSLATDAGTVQQQTITVTATSGTFRVGFGGQWTADLAEDISAADLQVALRLLPGLGSVTVSGTAPYTVTMTGTVSNTELLLATGFLNGGTVAVAESVAAVAPAITTTAAQLKTAYDLVTAATDLATVANSGADNGSGVVTAMARTHLSGGVNIAEPVELTALDTTTANLPISVIILGTA